MQRTGLDTVRHVGDVSPTQPAQSLPDLLGPFMTVLPRQLLEELLLTSTVTGGRKMEHRSIDLSLLCRECIH